MHDDSLLFKPHKLVDLPLYMKNEWNIVGVAVHQAILQLVTRGLQRLQDVAGAFPDLVVEPNVSSVSDSLSFLD